MNVQVLSTNDELRTVAVVFSEGDEVSGSLVSLARQHGISAASFTGIGALSRLTVGFFDLARRDYQRIELNEQLEVLTLSGNIATKDDEPKVHAHLVVGRSDGTAHGGHLLEAIVRPTLEVIVTETPVRLVRRIDPATGLALLDLATQ
jgi:predicted DNA-binding protein with PD1-like motif